MSEMEKTPAGKQIRYFTVDSTSAAIIRGLRDNAGQSSISQIMETALVRIIRDLIKDGTTNVPEMVVHLEGMEDQITKNKELLDAYASGQDDIPNKVQSKYLLDARTVEIYNKLTLVLPPRYTYSMPSIAVKSYTINAHERAESQDMGYFNETDRAVVESIRRTHPTGVTA